MMLLAFIYPPVECVPADIVHQMASQPFGQDRMVAYSANPSVPHAHHVQAMKAASSLIRRTVTHVPRPIVSRTRLPLPQLQPQAVDPVLESSPVVSLAAWQRSR